MKKDKLIIEKLDELISQCKSIQDDIQNCIESSRDCKDSEKLTSTTQFEVERLRAKNIEKLEERSKLLTHHIQTQSTSVNRAVLGLMATYTKRTPSRRREAARLLASSIGSLTTLFSALQDSLNEELKARSKNLHPF